MKDKEIEELITELDKIVTDQELCVYPDKQTFDCCDCYLCRVDFYNKVRSDLKNLG